MGFNRTFAQLFSSLLGINPGVVQWMLVLRTDVKVLRIGIPNVVLCLMVYGIYGLLSCCNVFHIELTHLQLPRSDEAFASMVLALLHAFYFDGALLERHCGSAAAGLVPTLPSLVP